MEFGKASLFGECPDSNVSSVKNQNMCIARGFGTSKLFVSNFHEMVLELRLELLIGLWFRQYEDFYCYTLGGALICHSPLMIVNVEKIFNRHDDTYLDS